MKTPDGMISVRISYHWPCKNCCEGTLPENRVRSSDMDDYAFNVMKNYFEMGFPDTFKAK